MNDITVPRTKTQTKKMLVEERKKMRQQAKQSAFMRKTLNIYNGMKARDGSTIDFTIETLRSVAKSALLKGACFYCDEKLTLSNLALDHIVPLARGGNSSLSNVRFCCKSCNWQKGIMTGGEWLALHMWMSRAFDAPVVCDIKRRLTIGGKWSFGK